MSIFKVHEAHIWLRMLQWEEDEANRQATKAEQEGGLAVILARVDDTNWRQCDRILTACNKTFEPFESHSIKDRHAPFNRLSRDMMSWRDYCANIRALREAIEAELQRQLFYHYPRGKADALRSVDAHWGPIISAFVLAEYDIRESVETFASGRSTAAVFHMMRVAEYGLRAIAHERRVRLKNDKPLTHENWLKIIEEIEGKAREIQKVAPAGDGKDTALAFYNGAVAHIRALKDKYRNRVMHARERFNEHEAADAMYHTRLLMAGLATKINGSSKRQIRWKF